jgi:hypothetical protein
MRSERCILAVLDAAVILGIDVQTPDVVLEVVRQVADRGSDHLILPMLAPRTIIVVNDIDLFAPGRNLDGVHITATRPRWPPLLFLFVDSLGLTV